MAAETVVALHAAGVQVLVLGSRRMLERDLLDPGVARAPFGSFRDLERALRDGIAEHRPHAIWMAAAVADYSPLPHLGKVRSDADELVVRMRRNPKLIARLRQACGPDTALIGFKLLSHVDPDVLRATARQQLTGNALDFVVANDLADFGPEAHPVTLVGPHHATRIPGGRHRVARALVDRIGRQRQRAAASVALVCSDRVLLGQRRTRRALGAWAFPGGALEPGEDPWEAARRELREETGIELPDRARPPRQVVVHAHDGPTRWRITCFVVETDTASPPRATAELDARWVPRAAAVALEGLTPGTRTVLRAMVDP